MDNELKRNASGYIDATAYEALENILREERAKRYGYMPLVYICSPYRGDIQQNLEHARRYCAYALDHGMLPIAPHLLFPQFMEGRNEPEGETPQSRDLALYMGLILLSHCRELWYFGDVISEGMNREINKARWRNMVVRRFTKECVEVPI